MRLTKKLNQYLRHLIAIPYAQASRNPISDLSLIFNGEYPPGDLLLDVGCGLGARTLLYNAATSRHVIGVEIAPTRAAIAHHRAVETGAVVSIVIADAAALPFVSGCFQHIVSDDTWEHLIQPGQVMQECSRVLQPAGLLTISTLPYYSPWGAHAWRWLPIPWLHIFIPRWLFFHLVAFIEQHRQVNERLPSAVRQPWQNPNDPAHAQGLTVKALRDQLVRSDLVVQSWRLVPVGGKYHPILNRLVNWLINTPYLEELLTGLAIVIARKSQQTPGHV